MSLLVSFQCVSILLLALFPASSALELLMFPRWIYEEFNYKIQSGRDQMLGLTVSSLTSKCLLLPLIACCLLSRAASYRVLVLVPPRMVVVVMQYYAMALGPCACSSRIPLVSHAAAADSRGQRNFDRRQTLGSSCVTLPPRR
eukprot:768423-Hanusia_phi.AAC.5